MITWSIKLCSHMWHYVLSKIRRNLHRNIEIDRNWRSEELLKFGGGQKIFIFRGRGLGLRDFLIFYWGGSYPSAYFVSYSHPTSHCTKTEAIKVGHLKLIKLQTCQQGFPYWWGMGESPTKQKCVPFPTLPWKISHTVDHPPPNFYSSLPFQKSIPLPNKDFQVITQYKLHF